MAVLLLLVSAAAFFLVSASPLDPLKTNVGQTALGSMSQEQIAKLEEYWGMNTPPVERFVSWAKDFFRGDMGTSLLYRQPVSHVISVKLKDSLWLMGTAWLISGAAGLLLGVVAGANRGKTADKVITGYALVTASTPAFWLALVLLMIFAVWLKVLPIGLSVPIGVEAAGVTVSDRIAHGILPALTLSITGLSNIILHTREKMAEAMESDYVLFAKARGESEGQIILRHGLRNIILPAMTLQFASISEIFGGSVLVEQVFSYPGIGQAAVTAGLGGDVPLLLGITVISAAIVFAGNFTANVLTASWIQESEEGGQRHEQEEDDDSSRGPVDSDAGGHYGGRTAPFGGCHGDGFFQKESGALSLLSIWNGLDGERHVCPYHNGTFHEHPDRAFDGGYQRGDCISHGNSGRDHGENRGWPDHWAHRSGYGNSSYPFAGAHILCTGKGILGCCDWNCADALDFPCTPDPRRGSAAEAEPVHKDSGKTGTGKAYHCVETYDASSDSAAVRWAGSDVSPCDPARSQHHISGLWTVAGTAGHRCHFVGKHEISRHGKMVARPFPGIVSGLCGAAVSFYGKHHQPAFGSGTRTSVKYPARVRWTRKRAHLIPAGIN